MQKTKVYLNFESQYGQRVFLRGSNQVFADVPVIPSLGISSDPEYDLLAQRIQTLSWQDQTENGEFVAVSDAADMPGLN